MINRFEKAEALPIHQATPETIAKIGCPYSWRIRATIEKMKPDDMFVVDTYSQKSTVYTIAEKLGVKIQTFVTKDGKFAVVKV